MPVVNAHLYITAGGVVTNVVKPSVMVVLSMIRRMKKLVQHSAQAVEDFEVAI